MKQYGIVIADDGEYRPLLDAAQTKDGFTADRLNGRDRFSFRTANGSLVTAVCCGIGKVNAATAAAFLIADGADVILNAGFSGSLVSDARFSFVLATESFEADFDLTPLGYAPYEKPGQTYRYKVDDRLLAAAREVLPDAAVAPVACGDLFLTDVSRGRALHESYGTVAFDMESGAVASVCFHSGKPFLILRQVSDGADESAASEYASNCLHAVSLTDALLKLIDRLDREEVSA